jgi:uncharacterized circularly permuted ATP-grasp superfamily protein/uncharacterized alpha-E superfamily protein
MGPPESAARGFAAARPPAGEVAAAAAAAAVVAHNLARLPPGGRRHLRRRLRRAVAELGLSDAPPLDDLGADHGFWDLQPQPVILDAAEWARLRAGLAQRARFVNALLADLHGERFLLRQRRIDPEIVLGDPTFRRPACGLLPPGAPWATVLRFDLVRTVAHGWCLVDTHANTPAGFSLAVQNRRFVSEEAPEVYANLPDAEAVVNFPLHLLQHLSALAPERGRAPSMVILTSGPSDPWFVEHGYLARKTGLPLARGDDLLVVGDRVYFRTIYGLEPVDVIYRRLNDAHLDPVAMPTPRELAGVPGLLHCVRRGTVALANAVGTGLAENRALAPATPALMRALLGERPLLADWPAYYCGDKDQLDLVLSDPDEFAFLPVRPSDITAGDPAETETPATQPPGELAAHPQRFVARRRLQVATTAGPEGEPVPFRLACFALCRGPQVDVLPGGLAFIGETALRSRPGATADTLVLAAAPPAPTAPVLEVTPATPPAVLKPARPTVGARSADNLYWLGRYVERADGTARRLALLEEVALEELPRAERDRWLPHWLGILESTGAGEQVHELGHSESAAALTRRLALDPDHPGSVVAALQGALRNARQTREHLSPEAWRVLFRLDNRVRGLAARARRDRSDLSLAALCLEATMERVPAFFHIVDRTMLHDAGWHFLQTGALLERAIMTCGTLRRALGDTPAGRTVGTREVAEFAALLRMLVAQDAFLRSFRSRGDLPSVARFFVADELAPQGLAFCLHRIRDSLAFVGREGRPDAEPDDLVQALIDDLAAAPVERLFAPGNSEGAEWLATVLLRLLALHEAVSNACFTHHLRDGGRQNLPVLAEG